MDNLIRVIARDGSVMCCAVDSTKMRRRGRADSQDFCHSYAALGRLLTARML